MASLQDEENTRQGLPSVAELAVVKDRASTATITHAAGASNKLRMTVTAKDADGATVASVQNFLLWASEAATGAGLTGDSYSGDLVAVTGTVLASIGDLQGAAGVLAAIAPKKRMWIVQTDANGVFVGDLTDTAKPADQYFCVQRPLDGRAVVSAISSTNWGA